MTRIESKKVVVNCPDSEVFEYLLDMNNFKELLPQDKISNWTSSEKECSFKVQNTATIALVQKGATPSKEINIVSGDKSPFPFTLNIYLEATDAATRAYMICDAEVNPFLKMMIEKPLSNLFNYIADQLVAVKS